jgi:hypothetical protein
MPETERRARVERLLQSARILADGASEAGRALRAQLLETTGLSRENIELGLSRCLETSVSDANLAAFVGGSAAAPRVHVLLSGNVFVAALRAIALGLAASNDVYVRASRRDPALAQALHALGPELFRLESELQPQPGDHFYAYGSDETLGELRRELPRGVCFHAHGSGFGAVVVEPFTGGSDDARAIALDTALFDQRGCLSPRVVCVAGAEAEARRVAQALAKELAQLEREVPSGAISSAEAATRRRERDTAAYAFETFDAGGGWVSLSPDFVLPPATRSLHVCFAQEPAALLAPFRRQLTGVAANSAQLRAGLAQQFANARVVALGELQRPLFDGPVDRRSPRTGELLS